MHKDLAEVSNSKKLEELNNSTSKNVPSRGSFERGIKGMNIDAVTGRRIPVLVNNFPNRRMRRMEKQAQKGRNNRKVTPGRTMQIVDITFQKKVRGKVINVPTGFTKRIQHQLVESKLYAFAGKIHGLVFARNNPLKSEIHPDAKPI